MYYRKNGNIIREPQKQDSPHVKEEFNKGSDQHEVMADESEKSSSKFPMWVLILIIVAMVLLGGCLIWWIWVN
jgi:cobalamin biosynthesis Mg chelatase CobN